MKLFEFESLLQQVDHSFTEPKIMLEQYPTSSHLASRMIYTADNSFDDICDKSVCDLGCGTGMLAIASCLMGSSNTVGIDVDADALLIAKTNIEEFELPIDLVCCDVNKLNLLDKKFDTVVMNPPFGTRNKGIDMVFLQQALQISKHAVYSMHKSSTRDFIEKKARQWGVHFEVVAQLKFDIPKMYKFHKDKTKDVMVDLVRLTHSYER